jgi:hypothetical protein
MISLLYIRSVILSNIHNHRMHHSYDSLYKEFFFSEYQEMLDFSKTTDSKLTPTLKIYSNNNESKIQLNYNTEFYINNRNEDILNNVSYDKYLEDYQLHGQDQNFNLEYSHSNTDRDRKKLIDFLNNLDTKRQFEDDDKAVIKILYDLIIEYNLTENVQFNETLTNKLDEKISNSQSYRNFRAENEVIENKQKLVNKKERKTKTYIEKKPKSRNKNVQPNEVKKKEPNRIIEKKSKGKNTKYAIKLKDFFINSYEDPEDLLKKIKHKLYNLRSNYNFHAKRIRDLIYELESCVPSCKYIYTDFFNFYNECVKNISLLVKETKIFLPPGSFKISYLRQNTLFKSRLKDLKKKLIEIDRSVFDQILKKTLKTLFNYEVKNLDQNSMIVNLYNVISKIKIKFDSCDKSRNNMVKIIDLTSDYIDKLEINIK